jgi:RNA-directed DNA polymerase
MYEWKTIPWHQLERQVFKLQKRIYRASQRGDVKTVHRLQRLLMRSRAAKLLATRKVTQDNQGRKTAGIDGITALTPSKRLKMAHSLNLIPDKRPNRRVWIPKPGTQEQRPLGIPTMRNRCQQALVKLALEPEWEAKFEPNSYGFRPGRGCHDAITQIFLEISQKAKYVLDADINQCFDKINHTALMAKINSFPLINRLIRGWLTAGVMDGKELFPSKEGTPQGGVISPLLANIALHGLETKLKQSFPQQKYEKGKIVCHTWKPGFVRYADDFVILHRDLGAIQKCRQIAQEWLQEMGLTLSEHKTRICHTLYPVGEEELGFDFLGFNVRQYPVPTHESGKGRDDKRLGHKTLIRPSHTSIKTHNAKLREIIDSHKSSSQKVLCARLNPVIAGWTSYYSTVVSSNVFHRLDYDLFPKLWSWAKYRHNGENRTSIAGKYWRLEQGSWKFATKDGFALIRHDARKIERHVKVRQCKSPFDGDWAYWATRRGHDPTLSRTRSQLLKKQKGKCSHCHNYFHSEDLMELHHIDGKRNNNRLQNLTLIHRHCHDQIHGKRTNDNGLPTEEPDEAKVSRPVLKTSRPGDRMA